MLDANILNIFFNKERFDKKRQNIYVFYEKLMCFANYAICLPVLYHAIANDLRMTCKSPNR